jgi:hypothetical protein
MGAAAQTGCFLRRSYGICLWPSDQFLQRVSRHGFPRRDERDTGSKSLSTWYGRSESAPGGFFGGNASASRVDSVLKRITQHFERYTPRPARRKGAPAGPVAPTRRSARCGSALGARR